MFYGRYGFSVWPVWLSCGRYRLGVAMCQ